ncbi:response regulator transcription factor [Paenibacillus humicola]|uniref:response regulator transcription factor n=1 Tax=Paenibacillus humicola TaxID=3110540 RepID=UPI00237BE1CB|nr:response regulator [Paenibacillus humicola]
MYNVLLVDDEPLALEGLELMIDWGKRGFRIDGRCGSGEEAVGRIRLSPPDLVVTDIRMPVLDGLGLIEETRRLGNRSTLFVIASGYHDFEYARRAMRLGVRHYLTKPVVSGEADELLARLQRELRERERQQAIRVSARRYAVRHALSVLLFGGEEAGKREALRALSHLPLQRWVYIHIETDPQETERARAAAERLADSFAFCCLIDCGRGTFGLVYGGDFESGDGGLRGFAQRLYETAAGAAAGRAGIAVGCVTDLGGLDRSFRCAEKAGRFLFFSGGSGIVHYEDVKDRTLSCDTSALQAADAITAAMEGGDPDRLASAVGAAFRAFEARMTVPELVDSFATETLLRCVSVYKELGGDPDALLTEADFLVSGGRRSLRAIEAGLAAFCRKCQDASLALQMKHTGGTAAKVAEFLREHYRETVTIKEIAERFYMNPVYMGQLFARKYGMGMLDFVHDLRIEEARRLLLQTGLPSGTVAESLGYRNYQHFLKQFERRLGMKPADYKQAGGKLPSAERDGRP